ncbi:MAG: 30S ribosomal protein S18 [Bacteriovoracaceae bacterium]|nr:30S ribosomal protein S18 [Bacteriovoracaceae bacterium]
MIYELAIVAKSGTGDEKITALTELIHSVIKEENGEVVLQDDWGERKLAQATSKGLNRGHFLYFIFKACSKCNSELARRLKINEVVIKTLTVKLGENDETEKIIKGYRTPYSKKYNGSVLDLVDGENSMDVSKDRRKFVRKKSCWFTAKKVTANWKDPATFTWLINEFGKISPARITGISCKHQRFSNLAIKRARQIGVVSHITNRIAE